MKLLYKLVALLLAAGMVAVGALFTLQNTQAVPLDLLVYQFPPQSISLWVLSSLAIGGLLGMLASSGVLLRLRASLSSANRKLDRARAEVDRLRTAGLKNGE